MRAVFEHHHLRARHSPLKIRDGFGRRLVMTAGEEQHRQLQLAQAIGPIVVAQQPGGRELRGAPHVAIDLVAAGDAFTLRNRRQRLGAANEVLFEHVVGRLARRIIGGLHRFALVQGRLHRLRQRAAQPAGIGEPARRADQRARENHRLDALLTFRQQILGRQRSAPRVSEDMHLAKAERVAERIELVDESRGGPQVEIGRAIGLARSQLVVSNDPAVGGQLSEHREATASSTGTAVQQQ